MVPTAHVLMVHSADGVGTVPIPLSAVTQHISNNALWVVSIHADIVLITYFIHTRSRWLLSSSRPPRGQVWRPARYRRANDPQLHIYLQVAVISQTLNFVTRPYGPFFMEVPSYVLLGAFCVAQLRSSITAVCAYWGFTRVHGISGGRIGIASVWNIIWFLLLDLTKFGVKATVLKYLPRRHEVKTSKEIASADAVLGGLDPRELVPEPCVIHRTRGAGGRLWWESVQMSQGGLQRFASIQAAHTGKTLACHPSGPS